MSTNSETMKELLKFKKDMLVLMNIRSFHVHPKDVLERINAVLKTLEEK